MLSIIKAHDDLKLILLPGFSAPNSTYWSFQKYMMQNGYVIPSYKPSVGLEFDIEIFGKKRKCVVLNSTSTATRIPFSVLVEQFKKYIV